MVKAHISRHLLAIIACFSVLTLHSDGAFVYGQPRHLGYERHLESPNHADTVSLDTLSDLTGGHGGIRWEDEEADSRASQRSRSISSSSGGGGGGLHGATNVLTTSGGSSGGVSSSSHLSPNVNNHLQTMGRPPPSSYMPERFVMVPPEQNFLRELVLHSAAPHEEARGVAAAAAAAAAAGGLLRSLAVGDYALADNAAAAPDNIELKFPGVNPAALGGEREWSYHDNSPLYVKPKRLFQRLPQELLQRSSYYNVRDASLTEPRAAASKRWWGGYRRPRGQMDRRASQSKHYDCLKSCIKEGKLHPIQCHTLC